MPPPVVYPRGEALLDTLRRARERGEAVGAFNVYNLEGVLAVRRAVERVGAPAIVQLHPASLTFGGTALVAACLNVSLGCSAAPMHVQLDHAEEEAAIRLALAAGVHGLMADGSGHEAASAARDGISELEANIAWTRRMAALAHAEGAAVEAELGKLAGMEDGLAVEERDAKMTDPAVVARFLAETRADVLAVTIGNVHGKYARQPPHLDWARLDAVRAEAGETPLVLHGASGLPDDMLRRAIRAGICKFNVNTEVRAAAVRGVAEASAAGGDVLDLMRAGADAMVPVVEAKLRAFRPGS